VPILSVDKRVNFREIHIGENDGDVVRVLDGLTGTETIALNLGESVADGSHVQPIEDASNPH
jgi:hypothetical protein